MTDSFVSGVGQVLVSQQVDFYLVLETTKKMLYFFMFYLFVKDSFCFHA